MAKNKKLQKKLLRTLLKENTQLSMSVLDNLALLNKKDFVTNALDLLSQESGQADFLSKIMTNKQLMDNVLEHLKETHYSSVLPIDEALAKCKRINNENLKRKFIKKYIKIKSAHLIDDEKSSESIVLNSGQLMDKVIQALDDKKPLSVISVGATESFVMAQYTIFPEEEFMAHPEAWIANQGVKSGYHHRGIRFPNVQLRDEVVEAVRKADIVGYNTVVKTMDAGLLTEKVFDAYDIQPKYIFEANLRRVLMISQKEKWEKMLQNKKILLISSIADKAKEGLEQSFKDKLNFDIVGTIPIFEYEDIPNVKKEIEQYDFDLCLIAAGTNAILLATHIAEQHGKVAVDIGSGMESLYTGETVTDEWIESIIGLDNIMKM